MFKNSKLKKSLLITLSILMFSTVVFAANGIYDKKLTATHGRIKFMVDGKDVTSQIESKYGSPAFVVKEYGSRAYAPVRAMADLMGLKIEYDNNTHTAEIIDIRTEEYERKLGEKDKEIKELKAELEKLKKNVVEETDLKAVEKKLNGWYSTYEDVEFDIKLKESKNRVDVDIIMDLRDGRQESYWNRMTHSKRKEMIEDIADTIAKEFPKADIYGSIYDNSYRRDVMSFNKKSGKSTSISYDGRGYDSRYDSRYDDRYGYGYGYGYLEDEIDYIIRREIDNAYLYNLNDRGRTIYLDIRFSGKGKEYWEDLSSSKKEDIIDRIADKVDDYYYYDYYYYDDYYDYYRGIEISLDGDEYYRSFR